MNKHSQECEDAYKQVKNRFAEQLFLVRKSTLPTQLRKTIDALCFGLGRRSFRLFNLLIPFDLFIQFAVSKHGRIIIIKIILK